MLSWLFKPRCPVDAETKQWIEKRFNWLTGEFGIDRLTHRDTILPTEQYLPLEFECTEQGIESLMHVVARYMDVDPSSLHLKFYEEDRPKFLDTTNAGTAGYYTEADNGFDIWLEVNTLHDPGGVLATLAHEIGHVLLLGQRRIFPEEEDHEPLTDLLTVFLGMGIFPANSVIQESHWRDGQWSGWSVGKRGYMSMDMYGYAMALYSLARLDTRPSWMVHLRPDVRAALKRGIRYITETQDCAFLPAIGR